MKADSGHRQHTSEREVRHTAAAATEGAEDVLFSFFEDYIPIHVLFTLRRDRHRRVPQSIHLGSHVVIEPSSSSSNPRRGETCAAS